MSTTEAQAVATPQLSRRRFSPDERRSLVGMGIFVALLHVLGWGTLIGIVAPQHYQVGEAGVLGIGLGLVAYTLGMRHAFDADHIAAIDNTTRKLLTEHHLRGSKATARGQHHPMSVGFWFSLGHSTIVFVLVALLAFGVRAIAGQVTNEGSLLQQITGVSDAETTPSILDTDLTPQRAVDGGAGRRPGP